MANASSGILASYLKQPKIGVTRISVFGGKCKFTQHSELREALYRMATIIVELARCHHPEYWAP